jgi:hypothetical protein
MYSVTVTEKHSGHEMYFTVRHRYFLMVYAVANIQRVTLEYGAEKHVGLHVK